AEERHDAIHFCCLEFQMACGVRAKTLTLRGQIFGARDVCGRAQRAAKQTMRLGGAHRIAARDQVFEALTAIRDALHELVAHTRFAGTRGRGYKSRARDRLTRALVEQRLQASQLAVTTHTWQPLAKHRARRFAQTFFETQDAQWAIVFEATFD